MVGTVSFCDNKNNNVLDIFPTCLWQNLVQILLVLYFLTFKGICLHNEIRKFGKTSMEIGMAEGIH